MGVVSNKVDIEFLKLHNDVGNLDNRVTTLEGEMSGVYASINQISTVELPKVYSSINEISTVELPKVYSSISAVSDLILEPVMGLEDRVEVLEASKTEYSTYTIDNSSKTLTNAEVLTDMHNHFKAVGANYKCCEVDYISITGYKSPFNTTILSTSIPFTLATSSSTAQSALSNIISPHFSSVILNNVPTIQTFGYMLASINLSSSTRRIMTYDTTTTVETGTTTSAQNVIDGDNTTEIITNITVRYKPMIKR